MSFLELLKQFCSELSCSNKELSKKASISPSYLSRLKRGEIGCNVDKEKLKSICDALLALDGEKRLKVIPANIHFILEEALEKEIIARQKSLALISKNIDFLLTELGIKNNHIARHINLDPSFLSRIRNNKRRPFNLSVFIQLVSDYLIKFYFYEVNIKLYSEIFNIDIDLINKKDFHEQLLNWLVNDDVYHRNYITPLFDIIVNYKKPEIFSTEAIYNELESKFIISTKKTYYNAEETKQAIIDFYYSIIISPLVTNIYIYNDFPLNIYFTDKEFVNKWMLYMDLAIKKGNFIYKTQCLKDSSLAMIEEIKFWLPFYMSGYVKPFVINKDINNIPNSLLLVAENIVAVSGESTIDKNVILTTLTKVKEELLFFEKKIKSFINIAKPLITIFKEDEEKKYEDYLLKTSALKRDYIRIINMPPNFAMSNEFLEKLLFNNNASEDLIKHIDKRSKLRNNALSLYLKDNKMIDILKELSEEEFALRPRKMRIKRYYNNENIIYSYQDYLEHIALTKKYSESNPNYQLIFSNKFNYEDLEYYIKKDESLVIEKTSDPQCAIIFENEKIIKAFEEEVLLAINN